ncbi:unnamed protein product [Amoebophrya sp. A120]|nr:unnamed protein product [Amoebophrya sp. A120]|eukprot:GSA120T00018333001.1
MAAAPAAPQGPVITGEMLILNDEIVDMLQLLDYDGKGQFCDKEMMPMPRSYFSGAAPNAALQFKYFAQLCAWLFRRLQIEPTWGKYDDPQTICTNLCVLLKDAGVAGSESVSPQKLKQGYGESVLGILHSLVKLTLQRANFRYNQPQYPDEALADEAEVDDDAQGSDIEEEEGLQHNDEEEFFPMTDERNNAGAMLEESDTFEGVMEATIDPQQWALELERVGPKLKVAGMEQNSKEWRAHLSQTKSYQEVIDETFPEARGGLENLHKELHSLSERMRNKEAFINSQFDHRALEFRNRQEELTQVTRQYNELNEGVMNLQIELKGVTEELDEVKGRMESLSTTVTDTAPIVKIKDAFQKLRAETRQIEVKIGVVGHTLMQAKLRQKKSDGQGMQLAGPPEEGEV